MTDAVSARLVSIGGDPLDLKGGVGFGVTSQNGGLLKAFFTSKCSGVSVLVGNNRHWNCHIGFLVQPGAQVCFHGSKGDLIDHLTVLGLTPRDGKNGEQSVLVH